MRIARCISPAILRDLMSYEGIDLPCKDKNKMVGAVAVSRNTKALSHPGQISFPFKVGLMDMLFDLFFQPSTIAGKKPGEPQTRIMLCQTKQGSSEKLVPVPGNYRRGMPPGI